MLLKQGDIFGIRGKGINGWLSRHMIRPTTDRFHFGLLWQRTPDNDWIILESIWKGIAVGRLSWYKPEDIQFYRVACPVWLAELAPVAMVKYGRKPYDYGLIFHIAWDVINAYLRIWVGERKLRRPCPEDISYHPDKEFICTEAVAVAYKDVGCEIIPTGVAPIPQAFKQAELAGRIFEVREDAP